MDKPLDKAPPHRARETGPAPGSPLPEKCANLYCIMVTDERLLVQAGFWRACSGGRFHFDWSGYTRGAGRTLHV